MRAPCEISVWYILPFVRRTTAISLVAGDYFRLGNDDVCVRSK